MADNKTPSSLRVHEPLTVLDGGLLRELVKAAAAWLNRNKEKVNALNVFPVPDGDTGTNMNLTMRSALKELEASPATRLDEVAKVVAQGALLGARGNSGVILSQLLRGFARGLEGKETATTADIAAAFQMASKAAYSAVMKPVEGTILTVAREAAEEAERSAAATDDIVQLLENVLNAAQDALRRTPEMLQVLKDAGVVDSGGQGLVFLFEGMVRYLKGEPVEQPSETSAIPDHLPELDAPPEPLADGRYGYDIQFLIRGENLDVDAIREVITSMGDCALVVGDSNVVKVHVHCLNPGPALEYGANLGMLDDIVVENMDLQYEQFKQQAEHAPTTPPMPTKRVSTEAATGIATVAVVPGDGLREIFESLNVSAIVPGGQTMNPSTQDLLEAINAVESDTVIVLPNNKNIILAAQQAAELSEKTVYVVPTRTVPQGIAAMMAFNFKSDVESNVQNMQEAAEHVVSGEVTRAVRTTQIDGVEVQEGDFIGILDGRLVVAAKDLTEVVRSMLKTANPARFEIATFYYGADLSEEEAHRVIETLRAEFPELEMEVVYGGQPNYHFFFSLE